MNKISEIYDKKINAKNIMLEMSVYEYLGFAKEILKNNQFQRKRVSSSGKIYSLLKSDLKNGCILPPIVLACSSEDVIETEKPEEIFTSNIKDILILDGLQRTYTMIDLEDEMRKKNDDTSDFYGGILRIELYLSISRHGILYRMLTLNTGQTKMSLRHQIEMLYSDYYESQVGDIKLLRDVDETTSKEINTYPFKDMVQGLESYISRDFAPIDRYDILEYVKSIGNLSKERNDSDLFKAFMKTYSMFVNQINNLYPDWQVSENTKNSIGSNPFAKEAYLIFKKEQAISGFGNAIAEIFELETNMTFTDIQERISFIEKEPLDEIHPIDLLILRLDNVRRDASKIGVAQRQFFYFFFRMFFDNELEDTYLKFEKSIEKAYAKYERLSF